MGCTMLDKLHVEVVETAMDLVDIGRKMDPHDHLESQKLAKVHVLLGEALDTRQVGPVRMALAIVEQLIEENEYEDRELHAPIEPAGKLIGGYHDRIGLTGLAKMIKEKQITAIGTSGDAA